MPERYKARLAILESSPQVLLPLAVLPTMLAQSTLLAMLFTLLTCADTAPVRS
jgi:hypothetical protein